MDLLGLSSRSLPVADNLFPWTLTPLVRLTESSSLALSDLHSLCCCCCCFVLGFVGVFVGGGGGGAVVV